MKLITFYLSLISIVIGTSCIKKKISPLSGSTIEFIESRVKNFKNFDIPKKIHQIWIGSDTLPGYYDTYLETFKKNAPDYKYRLWTNKDITPENFPKTYPYILKAVETGIKMFGRNDKMWKGCPTRKLAQIADLMRLEIIAREGGFYFDVKTELFSSPDKFYPSRRKTFNLILANESPCGLECKSANKYYLSNSFFAAPQKHPLIEELLIKEKLEKINFTSHAVNEETGPHYLGEIFTSNMRKEHKNFGIFMISTNYIYPFINWTDDYRKAEQDKCISPTREKLAEISNNPIEAFSHKGHTTYALIPCDQYQPPHMIMHWGLGGTWH